MPASSRIASFALVLVFLVLSAAAQVPHSSHVWIVTEENHSYENVVASMPHLMWWANQYGLATQYYADMHNSLSTLMHLTAGQTITLNDSTTATFDRDNLVRAMLPAGLTFKLYQEELPYAGFSGLAYAEYVKRHNPLAYFTDVANSSLKYDSVPYSQLSANLGGANSNLNYVTPDLLHDAHDGTMQAADYWLSQQLPAILSRAEFQPGGDGLLFIVFDEGNLNTDNRCSAAISSGCGGRVATVVIGPKVKRGFKSATWYDHESLLKTVCLALGTPLCPGDAQNARPMSDFFGNPAAFPAVEPMNMVLTLPVDGATSGSPVRVAACATSANPISGWYVYVDNAVAWHTSSWVQCINTTVPAAVGTHKVSVRAWDSSGASTGRSPTVTIPMTVHLASPTLGETVGPSVQVLASALSSHTVVSWSIYVDNTAVWQTGAGSSIDKWIGITPGTHTFTVRAWDSTGAYASASAKTYLP